MKRIYYTDREQLLSYCLSNLLRQNAYLLIECPKEYGIWMDKIEHNFPPEQHHTYFRRLLPTVKRVSDGMSVWVIEGQRKFLSSTERERQQHLKIFTKTSSKQKLIHATHLR